MKMPVKSWRSNLLHQWPVRFTHTRDPNVLRPARFGFVPYKPLNGVHFVMYEPDECVGRQHEEEQMTSI
jgi:hypothetical protein